jgi:FlaG/FlaF family flagellin (archaellin)
MSNKRGVSELVSYVLLISITFAIAAIVYGWLMFYVTPAKEVKCEEGITLTIRSLVYNCTSKSLNMTLQNRGLFNVDGYRVRVNNKSGADIGVYTINMTGRVMNTSNGTSSGVIIDYYARANITDVPYPGTGKPIAGNLTFIEVQPYSIIENENVACDNLAKHAITCA